MNLTEQFKAARRASHALAMLPQEKIDSVIREIAKATRNNYQTILEANAKDLQRFDKENPLYDRLLLTKERIMAIADDMDSVAELHSPIGEVISSNTRPNGMRIDKVKVPFGVIGVIYEARPNVSFDVFVLCFKTASCAILKGGSDAAESSKAIVALIQKTLQEQGIDPQVVTLLPPQREATAQLLDAVGYVDLIIPRGSSSLINYVRDNSRVPVIETGAGVCHTYIDKCCSTQMAADIVFNAKTRRVSVCNALDTIIIHKDKIGEVAQICLPMAEKNVEVYADTRCYAALKGTYPDHLLFEADSSHFGVEFLDYRLSIRSVESISEAIEFVSHNTSHHSEAIVTDSETRAQLYCKSIDAACVYVNVSTAFTDGGQFGFGAEIGISTQKLHARGPMALEELTVYKYIIRGNGQTRK